MFGAIVGDIVGSVYEWNNIKTKDFPLFREDCFFTDDTSLWLDNGLRLHFQARLLAGECQGYSKAVYGIPEDIACKAYSYLDDTLKDVVQRWAKFIGPMLYERPTTHAKFTDINEYLRGQK